MDRSSTFFGSTFCNIRKSEPEPFHFRRCALDKMPKPAKLYTCHLAKKKKSLEDKIQENLRDQEKQKAEVEKQRQQLELLNTKKKQ